MQIMVWRFVKGSPRKHVDGILVIGQSEHRLSPSLNSLFFWLNLISFRRSDVSHIEPFSVARSCAYRVFCGATSFSLTSFFQVFSSLCFHFLLCWSHQGILGSWCTCDMICSMMGTVLLTEEVHFRLAALEGFSTPNPPKWTGSASLSLSNWLHCRSVMERMEWMRLQRYVQVLNVWQSSQEIGPSMV